MHIIYHPEQRKDWPNEAAATCKCKVPIPAGTFLIDERTLETQKPWRRLSQTAFFCTAYDDTRQYSYTRGHRDENIYKRYELLLGIFKFLQ